MVRLTIIRLLESYFRHRWLYLLPILLFGAAAGVYLYAQEPVYTTRSVLYVEHESLLSSLNSIPDPFEQGGGWRTPAQITLEELEQMMKSDAFIRAVVVGTSLEATMDGGPVAVGQTFKEVRESIWIYRQGSNQLVVAVTHENPLVAYELVSAVVDTYLTMHINRSLQQSASAQQFFGELVATYEGDLERARAELSSYLLTHPEPLYGERAATEELEIGRLRSELDLASTRYENALQKRENAQLATKETEADVRQTFFVLDAPQLPMTANTSRRQMALDLLVFLGAGALVSLVAIAGSTLLDRSLRFPMDVQQRLQLPVVGVVPEGKINPAGEQVSETADQDEESRAKQRRSNRKSVLDALPFATRRQ